MLVVWITLAWYFLVGLKFGIQEFIERDEEVIHDRLLIAFMTGIAWFHLHYGWDGTEEKKGNNE